MNRVRTRDQAVEVGYALAVTEEVVGVTAGREDDCEVDGWNIRHRVNHLLALRWGIPARSNEVEAFNAWNVLQRGAPPLTRLCARLGARLVGFINGSETHSYREAHCSPFIRHLSRRLSRARPQRRLCRQPRYAGDF